MPNFDFRFHIVRWSIFFFSWFQTRRFVSCKNTSYGGHEPAEISIPLKTTVEELSFVFDISSTVWVNDLIQSLHNIAIINIIPINLLFTEWFYSFVIKFASFCVLVAASFSVACCGRFCCCLIPLDNPNGRERDKLFLSESFKRYDHSHIINLCNFRQNLHFFSSQKIVHSTFSFSGLEHFKTFRLGPAMPIFAQYFESERFAIA